MDILKKKPKKCRFLQYCFRISLLRIFLEFAIIKKNTDGKNAEKEPFAFKETTKGGNYNEGKIFVFYKQRAEAERLDA